MFILESLAAYAHTHKDKLAVVYRDWQYTFAQLYIRALGFAAYLRARYPGDKTPVVIYGHKEIDILPCIYGSLMAGHAYVPIDTKVPADRVVQIVAESNPKVVVDFYGLSLKTTCEMIDPGQLTQILESASSLQEDRSTWVRGEDDVYILFTSGSTGMPKGVAITVNNLSNLLPAAENMWFAGVDADKMILNFSSYSFDASVVCLFIALNRGMTLLTVDSELTGDIDALMAYISQYPLAFWSSTSSFAEMCLASDRFCERYLPHMRAMLFGGEVLTHKLSAELAVRFPGAAVLNGYGPTEATLSITTAVVTQQIRNASAPIPIGVPMSDEIVIRVVDENLQELPHGEAGELVVISNSVSKGYLNRPDLTEKVFFFDETLGKRGYRTGDLCCFADGMFHYRGRIDNQIKLNGYRIEIEDIENNFTKVQNITRAAVLPVMDDAGERVDHITAFVTLQQKGNLSALAQRVQILKEVGAYLPAYMLPRKIYVVDAFPLNTNGKIDKKELARLHAKKL